MLVAYLGLRLGYAPFLNGQIESLDNEAKKFSQEISLERQNEIALFYSQISNIKTLLGNHVTPSKIFTLLEEKTLPTVYFDKFELKSQSREMVLSGKTRSMSDVASQIMVFQEMPEVSKVTMKNAFADGSGVWSFELDVIFTAAFFGEPVVAGSGSATNSTNQTQ